jgi:N-acetylmuramoyl-L-alanine amidase
MAILIAFLAALAGLILPRPGEDAPEEGVTIALGEPSAEAKADLPPIYGARNPARPLVVLDAGHGGKDPGAIS